MVAAERNGQSAAFEQTVSAWLAASPSPIIHELIRATRLSRRQIERKCKALYNASPKLLARRARALSAANALVSNNGPIDEVVGLGFYDQSHLIRELKCFIGMTPQQIRASSLHVVTDAAPRRLPRSRL